jgi:hypothetical protein
MHLPSCRPERKSSPVLALLVGVLAAATPVRAQTTLDPVVVPVFGGSVNAIERVGDQVFVAGSFLGGSPPEAARGGLSIHGAIAATLLIETDYVAGDVLAVLPDGEGGYYIGGNFQLVGGETRLQLARIRSNGFVDSTFRPTVSSVSPGGGVRALARDGNRLYVGGRFEIVNGQPRGNLAVVDATTGALLTSFAPIVAGTIEKLEVFGTTLYVAGSFDAINGQARSGLAAFAASTGALLPWAPGVTSRIVRDFAITDGTTMIAVGADVRRFDINTGAALPLVAPGFTAAPLFEVEVIDDSIVVVGGTFTTLTSNGQTIERAHLVAFNPATGEVSAWAPNPSEPVDAMDTLGTTLYVGGSFARVGTDVRGGAAAFNMSGGAGTLLSWNPSMNGAVRVILVDEPRVLLGGEFTAPSAVVRRGVAQLDLVSNQLTTWQAPTVAGAADALAVASNRVLIGGDKLAISSGSTTVQRFFVVLDQQSGAEVAGWQMPDGPVTIIEPASDAVYIAGRFTTVGGLNRAGIAAFTLSGAVTAFSTMLLPGPPPMALAADATTLYIGGDFIVESRQQGLLTVDRVGGGLPEATVPVLGIVDTLRIAGATLYIGGEFTAVAGTPRINLAAIELSSRSLTSWNPGGAYTFRSQALAAGDGRIVAAGTSETSTGLLTTFAVIDTEGTVLRIEALDGPIRAVDVPAGRVLLGGAFDDSIGVASPGLALFTVGSSAAGAPRSLQASVAFRRVTLTWLPPASGGPVTGYSLEAGAATGTTQYPFSIGNVTSFAMDAPNGTYFVRVRANSSSGLSPASNEVQVVVSCETPPSPGPLIGSVSGDIASISWQPVAGVGVTYEVQLGTAPGATLVSVPVTGTNISQRIPPGMYYVRVLAVSPCGTSSPTNEVVLTVTAPAAPSAPTNVQATVNGSTVLLSWNQPAAGAPIATYVIEVGTSPATPANLLSQPIGPATSVVATAPSGTFYVRLRAQNAGGLGEPSAQVVVVVP